MLSHDSVAHSQLDTQGNDILLSYNILGAAKLDRLKKLREQVNLTVVADNEKVIESLATTFHDAIDPLDVLIECDTGANRCGVQHPFDVVPLAEKVNASAGLNFLGLMTYPKNNSAQTHEWLNKAKQACEAKGLNVVCISSGGTPDVWQAHTVPEISEYRAGTYIYNDRSLLDKGICTEEDCALTVMATVISRPTLSRVIIDAGSKSLSSDLLGLNGYGYICEYPDAHVVSLSEEHGVIELGSEGTSPEVGERIRVIPNHACPVSNLYDLVWLYSPSEEMLYQTQVAARGCVY